MAAVRRDKEIYVSKATAIKDSYITLAQAVTKRLCQDYVKGDIDADVFRACLMHGITAMVYDIDVLEYIYTRKTYERKLKENGKNNNTEDKA